jgi:hypothetical protein
MHNRKGLVNEKSFCPFLYSVPEIVFKSDARFEVVTSEASN